MVAYQYVPCGRPIGMMEVCEEEMPVQSFDPRLLIFRK